MSVNESELELFNKTLELTNNITIRHESDIQVRKPASILIGSLILPGVIGNLHVLHIYIFKKEQSNTRIFICFLALFDLLTCSVAIPYTIAFNLLPFRTQSDIACKLCVSFVSIVINSSLLTLLVIALERHRKICTPFKTQLTIKYAKLVCLLVATVSLITSVPTMLLFKIRKVPTVLPNVVQYVCNTPTELSPFRRTISVGLLTTVLFVIGTAMMLIYIRVVSRLRKQHRTMKIRKPTANRDVQNKTTSADSVNPGNEIQGTRDNNIIRKDEQSQVIAVSIVNKNDMPDSGNKNGNQKNNQRKAPTDAERIRAKRADQKLRITYSLFLATICYFLFNFPPMVVHAFNTLTPDWYVSLDMQSTILLNILQNGLFINSVVNPYIYILCDKYYREELKAFYCRLCSRNK